MKQILITGAAGFIGLNLAAQASKAGYHVRATDLLFSEADNVTYERRTGNILEPEFCRLIVEGIDSVVHLAAVSRAGEAEKDPLACLRVNVMGTATLLDACLKEGKRPNIIIASSREVESYYATNSKQQSVYGTSKKLAEDIAKYYCRRGNMSLNIVRLSDVYGKINISEKVLQIFIRNAVQGIPIVVKQPQAMFYFSHIKDICASLLKITMDDEGGNNDCITKTHRLWPYLGINLLELAKLICKISGSNSQIIVDHDVVKEASANQPEEQKVRYIDYQSLLSTSIEDGICELINSVI